MKNERKDQLVKTKTSDNDKETQNIIKPNKTQLRQGKFYDGQYALLNELPTVCSFFKELWNGPKRAIKAEKKPVQGEINFSEIKPTEVEKKDITNISPNTQQTAVIETQTTNNVSDLVTRTNKIPEIIRGIENIEVGSNSTNGTSKPKYKFKCQYVCGIINVTTDSYQNKHDLPYSTSYF